MGHQDSRHGRHPSAAAMPSVKTQDSNDNPLKSAEWKISCCLHRCKFEGVTGFATTERDILRDSIVATAHD